MPSKNGLSNSPPFTLFTIPHGEPRITYDTDGKKIAGFNGEDALFFKEIADEISRRRKGKKGHDFLCPISTESAIAAKKIYENFSSRNGVTVDFKHLHLAQRSKEDFYTFFLHWYRFIQPQRGNPIQNSALIIVGPEEAISAIRKSIWVPEGENGKEQENGEKRGERETAYVGEFTFRQGKIHGTFEPLLPKKPIKEGYFPMKLEGGVLLK